MPDVTPTETIRELGIEDCVSPLVDLALQNHNTTTLTMIVELAMMVGARGLAAYQERGAAGKTYQDLARAVEPWSWSNTR